MDNVVVIIPAHNEAEGISDSIKALFTQTHAPNRVVVVSDNSTDGTQDIVRSFGSLVELIETQNNSDMKSGALNFALDVLDIPDDDFVLVVDADTSLSSIWIERALQAFADDPKVGAVGGIFLGDHKNGTLGDVQGLEYARYRKELRRLGGEARVLTGTSTMMRMETFRKIKRKRESGEFTGSGYYNIEALTEDFEITICVKRLGLKAVSPDSCTVITETMDSIPSLWRQRLRWQRGAIDVLKLHGWNKITAPYILRQAESGLILAVNFLIFGLIVYTVFSGSFEFIPFWLGIGLIFFLERIQSSMEYGKKGLVLAATFVADFAFDMFIGLVWIWSLWVSVTNKSRSWGHS